jgi:hypothetical protein
MRMLKMVGLALIAVLAIGVMASASASALSFKTAKAEEEFTSNETGTYELASLTVATKVVCTGVHVKGFALNGTDLSDKTLFDFLGCKETAFNSSCQSGSTSGLILTNLLHGLLVWVLLSGGKRDPGILVTPESGTTDATFTCDSKTITFTVSGGVLGEYTGKLNESTTNFPFRFAESASEPGMELWTEYSSSETGGTVSRGALQTVASGLVSFKEESAEVATGTLKTGSAGEIDK